MSAQKGASKSAKGGGGTGKGKKAAGGNNRDEEETEEILQAVILADDFDTRFRPFTEEKPRCLLPLANTPLIDYTLQWLAASGVTEVFIYPGADTAAEVEAYLRDSKWNPQSDTSPFNVAEVIISKATSVGEAMRDLDRRKSMSGDFLVVHGDLICNIPIADALKGHKARKAKDKNAIMTTLLREGGNDDHRMKMRSTTPVFVVDHAGRCMHYEEINAAQPEKYIRIAADILSTHPDVEIRTDLIDCGIDICTPDVLALWTDEFDYQEPRKQFMHGVLKDFELNGKLIYIDLMYEDYAARVNSLGAYDAVSKDLLARWTYTVVPDNNILTDQTYKSNVCGVIKEDGVILSRGSGLGNKTIVGSETSIGDGAKINNSTIGRRCQIGKNVTIQESYIWDDVVIGDGAHITQSIIGSESSIGSNARISGGTVISFGVQIADNKAVQEGLRITKGNRQLGNSDQTDFSIVGEGGSGYIFTEDEVPEDENEEQFLKLQNNLFYSMSNLNISSASISTFGSTISGMHSPSSSRRPSTGSFSDEENISGFHHDAVQGLYDTLQENGDFDSAKLEFMGLRLSNNATDRQIRRAIAVAFTKNIATLVNDTEKPLDPLRAVKKSLDTRGAVPFLNEVAIGKSKVVSDQVEFLLEVQRDLCSRNKGPEILFALCQQMYEREIIEEEAVEEWWDDEKGSEGEEMVEVRVKAEAFIKWLREAEEEDSDEDESEEESDDE